MISRISNIKNKKNKNKKTKLLISEPTDRYSIDLESCI